MKYHANHIESGASQPCGALKLIHVYINVFRQLASLRHFSVQKSTSTVSVSEKYYLSVARSPRIILSYFNPDTQPGQASIFSETRYSSL